MESLFALATVIYSIQFIRKNRDCWKWLVPALIAGGANLIFHAAYFYRSIMWETCPPICGLQDWSTASGILEQSMLLATVIMLIMALGRKIWISKN